MTAALAPRYEREPPVPMGGPPLIEEWLHRPGLNKRHLELLAGLGVSIEAQERCGGLAVMKAQTTGNVFIPHACAAQGVVVPVWAGAAPSWYIDVEDPWLDDLAMFRPEEPERWWYRIGSGGVLGAHNHALALETGHPITLHATPLAWLKADCRGACDLNIPDLRG